MDYHNYITISELKRSESRPLLAFSQLGNHTLNSTCGVCSISRDMHALYITKCIIKASALNNNYTITTNAVVQSAQSVDGHGCFDAGRLRCPGTALGKAVSCTVSSCMGQNHGPSNCTNNYLRPKWAVGPPAVVSNGWSRRFVVKH